MIDEIINGFIQEVKELLVQLEDDLIALEKSPDNTEIINNIFRVMHTLKGSAGMVGYRNIQDLTHEFESVYSQIRDGDLEVNSGIIDITLKAKDLILDMLKGTGDDIRGQELIDQIKSGTGAHNSKISAGNSGSSARIEQPTHHRYVILFSPDKGVYERGLNPEKILKELHSAGDTYVLPHEKKQIKDIQKAGKICQTIWEIYLGTALKFTEVEEVFLFYENEEFQIFDLSQEPLQIDPILAEKLSKLYKNKIVPEQQLRECLNRLSETNPPDKIPAQMSKPPAEVANEIKTGEELRHKESSHTDTEAMVYVSSNKLDELMNLVSELVTITATMEVHAAKFKDQKMDNALENIEKLTKKFRNNALDLRLVPVGTLLAKFKRQVRDLSRELNKKVNLLIEGQDIEIDKSILKSIESPLQHIIRNSIDHGLEYEDERIANGKTPEGLLKITAFYSGASVIIQVQDDGRGINLERVRECAVKKGLILADQVVSKQELISMIMEPGFTTRENISMVSGRGVGMDVVRKELNSVGGGLEVFTENNLGTSITMKLPTTLTIIDTLRVDVGDTQLLIPVMDIEYCFKEENDNLFKRDNRYIQYKNNPIPWVCLRKQFGYPVSENPETMVIVINKFDRRYAITADYIVGEHQAVIKPLGALFVNQPFFSGGSIMVDGKLAFILDTNFLFNHVTKI